MCPRLLCGVVGACFRHTVLLLLMSSVAWRASAADEIGLAGKVPSGAAVFVELEGAGAVLERLQHSPYLASLLDSPQYRRLIDTPNYRKAQAARTIVEQQLQLDVWNIAGQLLGGRVGVALYPQEGSPQPHVVLVMYTAEPQALTRIRERVGPFLTLAEEQVQVSQGLDGWEQISAGNRLFVAWKDNWLVVSDERSRLDSTVKLVVSGDGAALAQDESYQALLAHDSREAADGSHARLVSAYVNMAFLNQAAGGRLTPEKLDNALSSLLFADALQMAARSPFLSVSVDVSEHGWQATAAVAAQREELGENYRAFAPPSGEEGVKPLPEAPRLLGGITVYRDFSNWYNHREQLLQEQLMPEFDKFESGLANLLPNKDFGEDVLPLVGQRLTFVAAPQDFSHLEGKPAVQLPGFALVAELSKPDEAAAILQLFFQTLTAILNIEAGQQGREPWVVTSESYQGVQIAYASYLKKPTGDKLGIAFNFLPAAARVGDYYVISSSLGLCRQLVEQLQHPTAGETGAPRTFHADLRVDPLVDLLESNREFFHGRIIQDGRTAEEAGAEFAALLAALRYFDSVRLSTVAAPESYEVQLEGTWK